MKLPVLKNFESPTGSLIIQELEEPHFDPNWHFHPHFQLFTVLEGTGTRLIGDSIQSFEPGDTVFLGPDVPHLWRSEAPYFEKDSQLRTKGVVLYFQDDFLGKEFLSKPEMHPIQQFLEESRRGISYIGATRELILSELLALPHCDDFARILRVLALLNTLAHSSEGIPITSYGYVNTYKVSETERMQKVHNYVWQHFQKDIRLGEAASLAGMSEAAFCRYFRTRANKTFTDFVSEIRIGHACKLLVDTQWTVSQIAYESGFDTLSNFNRNFKKFTRQTPREYRSAYRTSVQSSL
ncbi:AraC family transcriptional regulator [Arundinibacter roseus]|uniref:AraC family transcriptional regulator n=1 Tax=Arundinibacter roseus TaxID=2070510 RepID=A0A4R4KET9_9BACT|nr:AraC family transcriptional regulator [Arundinibacter roseus]TDB65051.1 AraC family transcriptional regulator [Arundinibacter roseus]